MPTWDLADYLSDVTEDFLRIEGIELSLRRIVRGRIGDPAPVAGMPKLLKDTDLGELASHAVGDWWLQLMSSLGDREQARLDLHDVVRVRNQICHFRGRTSPVDKRKLQIVHDWIAGISNV